MEPDFFGIPLSWVAREMMDNVDTNGSKLLSQTVVSFLSLSNRAFCTLATVLRKAHVKSIWNYWKRLQLPKLGVMPRYQIYENSLFKLLLWLWRKKYPLKVIQSWSLTHFLWITIWKYLKEWLSLSLTYDNN